MTKLHVSRAGEHALSKKYLNELSNFWDTNSSDIGIQFDLGSKKLFQPKNNMSSMLVIPGHVVIKNISYKYT